MRTLTKGKGSGPGVEVGTEQDLLGSINAARGWGWENSQIHNGCPMNGQSARVLPTGTCMFPYG